MVLDGKPEPGVVDRIDVESRAPDPEECLPPGEAPIASVGLSPGWVAITDRELLRYHPDRDPIVVRTLRPNVTGVVVRRAGGRSLLSSVPKIGLYAIVAVVVGGLLLSVSPAEFLSVPDAPGAGELETIIAALARALWLLGVVLVFSGILAGLIAATIVGYWLFSRQVTLVIERGTADPIECPTSQHAGRRAIRELEPVLSVDRPRRSKQSGE
jgi:hypothetical protein